MMKRILALGLAAAMLLGCAAFAQEEAADTRVIDYAQMFTDEQAETLQAEIIDFQENTGYDFVILTTNEDTGYDDYYQLAQDFAAAKSLGLGMNNTLLFCYVDLYTGGYYYITVFGDLENLMVNEDIQYLIDNGMEYINDGDFVGCFTWTMRMMTEALNNLGIMESTRVFDYAEMLTDEETETLESAIADFRALTGHDFVYLSTYKEMTGNENGDYMQEFYSYHGFGDGDARSGVMIYLDLNAGSYYIQNFGDMDTYVPQEELNAILEQCNPLMSEGEILQAVLTVIDGYAAHFAQ